MDIYTAGHVNLNMYEKTAGHVNLNMYEKTTGQSVTLTVPTIL